MVSNVAQRKLSLVAGNVTGGGGQPPKKQPKGTTFRKEREVCGNKISHLARDVELTETDRVPTGKYRPPMLVGIQIGSLCLAKPGCHLTNRFGGS